MSNYLAELLDRPEVLAESAIKKLEYLSGWQSIDVRLLADVNNKVRAKTTQLGLDADDTTGPELYHALLVKLSQDQKDFKLDPDKTVQKLTKVYSGHKVYALKHSVAKELLRMSPPRKLMKQLNYRSVDSMLKRENVYELFAVLQAYESPNFMKNFNKKLSKLTPSDFETQKIEIVVMPYGCWGSLKTKEVTNNPLLGVVYVWPDFAGAFGLCVQVVGNIEELRTCCAFLKLRQVEADFSKHLDNIMRSGLSNPLEISHLPVSWRTIFGYYGKRPGSQHTEFFGPHMLHEDISLLKSLTHVSSVFKWWQDLEYVAKRTPDGLVSFNLADVLKSYTSELSYESRSVVHAQNSALNEMFVRYLQHPSVEAHLMNQLSPEPVQSENELDNVRALNSFSKYAGVA